MVVQTRPPRIAGLLLLDQDHKGAVYTSIPHTALIDREGRVVKTQVGYSADSAKTMHKAIEELPAAPASQPATQNAE